MQKIAGFCFEFCGKWRLHLKSRSILIQYSIGIKAKGDDAEGYRILFRIRNENIYDNFNCIGILMLIIIIKMKPKTLLKFPNTIFIYKLSKTLNYIEYLEEYIDCNAFVKY